MTYTVKIRNGHHIVTLHEVKHSYISAEYINVEELSAKTLIDYLKERDNERTNKCR